MKRVEFPQSQCLAGVARADITPPVGIYHRMWGAATHDRSTGVHRPLTATLLLLQSLTDSTDSPRIVVALDHCLLWTTEMNRLLDLVSSSTGFNRDAIVVYFSHTHGAGLMGLERRSLPGGELIDPYLEEMGQKIVGLVSDAKKQLAPASIVFEHGQCDLAKNRDFHDADRNQYDCGYNPSGSADSTVVVGRVSNAAGKTIATIVNYACHPTTLAWDNTLISPDYVGTMREVIEGSTGAPCLFIQGASGDVGPREGFVGDTSVADRNGRQLGYAALATLEALAPAGSSFEYVGPVLSGATIGTWKPVSQSAERAQQSQTWAAASPIIPLKYRSDLPKRDDLERERSQLLVEEQAAVARHDQAEAQRVRALIERNTRTFSRVGLLPPGESYPFPLVAWRIGDAIWLALNGEHYNVLQRTLRERFPDLVLIIGTIANGSNVWYLLDQASYGLGLYQEEASVLARGSLETLIESATETIKRLSAN